MFNSNYDVVDTALIGNTKYELRQYGSTEKIYVYSSLQDSWTPYATKQTEIKWESIKAHD